MSNDYQNCGFTGFTGFLDNNNFGYENFGVVDGLFNMGDDAGSHLHTSEAAGPSQPYTGSEVLGDLGNLPSFGDAATAPASLYPWEGSQPQSEDCHANGYIVPPPNGYEASPITTPYGGFWDPSASDVTPTTVASSSTVLPQVSTHWQDDLGYDFPPTAGPSHPPAANLSPYHNQRTAEAPVPDPDPFGLFSSQLQHLKPYPEFWDPLSAPITSSFGPQRTDGRAKGKMKYDPFESSKEWDEGDEDPDEEGWDVALVHLWTGLDEIVLNGQPSGGLSPEKALIAKITKLAKDELKRSPLQNTKAGEGKRCRDIEDYLVGVMKAIPSVRPRESTKLAFLPRLADVLESRLVAVNTQPALREQPMFRKPPAGNQLEQTEYQKKKSRDEKTRREEERFHLERISCLFRTLCPKRSCKRVEIMIFAIVFLLYGPTAFSKGFVRLVSA